ncbi:hypothetical protein HYW18_01115 [Candidatus Uhrbacteria bacterium]|nr:hypothetical protein [Candidatus Uhrbacteria bacterium]
MSRRTKITVLLLVLLLALLLWWLLRRKEEIVTPVQNQPAAEEQATPTKTSLVAPLVVRESASEEEAGAVAVARMFAERYTSFSSESDFANVRDLFPLMTASLLAKEEARIHAAGTEGAYLGITSSVVTIATVEMDEARAVVDVGLQRQITQGEERVRETRYETLRLTLIQEEGEWLVSVAAWLK